MSAVRIPRDKGLRHHLGGTVTAITARRNPALRRKRLPFAAPAKTLAVTLTTAAAPNLVDAL